MPAKSWARDWLDVLPRYPGFDKVNAHCRYKVVGVTRRKMDDGAPVLVENNPMFLAGDLIQGKDRHADAFGVLKGRYVL